MILFQFFMRLASLFHKKAGLMVKGHKETFRLLTEKADPAGRYIWFHCASLGEFEQARPLIERIKKEHPQYKILLTFFSPSGYEVRKGYSLADVVCYLPFDTRRNVRRFLDAFNPAMAIFVKYEFWYNYIHESYLRNIPVYLISAIFRKEQSFFRKNSGRFGKILQYYAHIFVQDKNSETLLVSHGIKNVTITGDTRFDRVIEIKRQSRDLPLLKTFTDGAGLVLVAGSSWAPDEDIFIGFFNEKNDVKLVIAPHEIHESHLVEIEQKLKRPFIRYSCATTENLIGKDCLIIDSFGLLSSVYRYGNVAYIGGGFGIGIHNLPEAAVYGIPVVFGPNYRKFKEAHDLIETAGGFSIDSDAGFMELMNRFMANPSFVADAGAKAGQYINCNAGATQKIMEEIKFA